MSWTIPRLFAALLALAAVAGCHNPQPPTEEATPPLAQIDAADTIHVGGEIATINDRQPTAEALAVKDGKILMPSFIDAHGHYINALSVARPIKLYAPPAGPGKDVESIVAELQRFALNRHIPRGEMIMGYGYDDTVMPKGRLLNRDDLDANTETLTCARRTTPMRWLRPSTRCSCCGQP